MSYIDAMEILMMFSVLVILLQPTLSEMDRFLFVLHHENIAKIISYKCSIIQYYHFYKSKILFTDHEPTINFYWRWIF